jgi:hypothetical protein
MVFPPDQIEELQALYGAVGVAEEGGKAYVHLNRLPLPPGCEPREVEALLCPSGRDGYPSRLLFAVRVQSATSRNWNFEGRILERNWHSFSWSVPGENHRLAPLVQAHLLALA